MKVRTSGMRGFALMALSALAFTACESKTETPPPPPPAVTVAVVPQSASLQVGQTQDFGAVVGNASNTAVTWASSNSSVASVSATGRVTAASVGSALITATSVQDPTKVGVASVVVTAAPAPVITLQLLPSTATISVAGTVQMTSIVTGTSNTGVTYSSTNPAVATVNASGLVTGVSVGSATIIARSAANTAVAAQSVITVVSGGTGEAVTITITPTAATIAPNGTQTFVATVGGTSNTAVTWASSAANVATIDANGLATAVGPGTTVITATSVADNTKRVTATLTVQSSVQPSISIQNVISQATGLPVSPNTAVVGTQTVTVNVSAGSETNISSVQVRLNGMLACEQTFSPPLAPTQGVAQITCPINTAATNADGTPRWPNGTYSLTAVAISGGADVATATYGNLIFANPNVSTVVLSTDGANAIGGAGSVAPGLRWDEGNLIATVRNTMYAGGTVASVRVCLNANNAAIPTANSVAVPVGTICRTSTTSTDNAFTVTFPKGSTVANNGVAGIEAQNMTAAVTTITSAGSNGPAGTSNALNLDNVAPVVTSLIINANQYVNGSFMFGGSTPATGCTTAPYTHTCFAMSDLGADSPTAQFNIQTTAGVTVDGGANVANPSGAAETTTSTERILQAVVTDLVGNTRTVFGSAAGAPSTTAAAASRFGIDLTNPTITVASGPAHNSSNPATNAYDFTFLDAGVGPSGFSATPLQIRVEQFTPDGTGGVIRRCIHPTTGAQLAGTSNGCTTASGFVTVADGNPDVVLPFGTVDAYWQVTARVRDFAGNMSTEVVRVTLNDVMGAPVVGNIVAPTSIQGGQSVTFSASGSDNVEFGDQLGYVGFAAIGAYLVSGRDILATYGFDVLTTPSNFTHTINPFIRSIETTAAGAPSGTIAMATDMNLSVRDMAGAQVGGPCLAAGAVGSTQNCTNVQTSIVNAVNLGMGGAAETSWNSANRPFGPVTATNPNGGGTAFNNTTTTAAVCSNIPVGANAGCNVVTSMNKTLTATATGPNQTFANPFQRVNFYYTDGAGRSFLIGTGSVSVTDNTVTGIRTWTYTASWNPNSMTVPAGTYPVFALGVDAQGRSLQSASVMVPVTSD